MNSKQKKISDAMKAFLPELEIDGKKDTVRSVIENLEGKTPTSNFSGSSNPIQEAQSLIEGFILPKMPEAPSKQDPVFASWFQHLYNHWFAYVRNPFEVEGFCPQKQLRENIEQDLWKVIESQLFRSVLDCLERRRDAGMLRGETSESRFDDFYYWLTTPAGLNTFVFDYFGNVLQSFHQFSLRCDCWVELIGRLQNDLEEINSRLLSPLRIDTLDDLDIEMGAGDSHNCGHSVAIISSGEIRFVYKPRCLEVDEALRNFFESLHKMGAPKVYVPSVISKQDYGWVEFIESSTCEVDLVEYAQTLGFLASIEYLLGGNDLHYENVKSINGSGLAIIDAETCVGAFPKNKWTYATASGSYRGAELLHRSVLGTGLLPMQHVVPGRDGIIEIGAAGIQEDTYKAPYKTLVMKNPGTDLMHVVLENLIYKNQNKNPLPDLRINEVVSFRDNILIGVQKGFDLVEAEKEKFLIFADSFFHDKFFRFVNSPTQTYSQVLRMATFPNIPSDPIKHLAVLCRMELFNQREKSALLFEVQQMVNGDVPVFEVNYNDCSLYGNKGILLVEDFFEASPRDAIRERVRDLEEGSIKIQLDLCQSAFARSLPVGGEATPALGNLIVNKFDLFDSIVKSSDYLLERGCQSINKDQPSTFWGPQISVEDSTQWTLGTLGYDLYGGSPGVALALSAAYRYTNIDRFADFSSSVFDPIMTQILDDIIADGDFGVGGFMGVAGTLWASVWHLRFLGKSTSKAILAALKKLDANLGPGIPLDYVIGQAGLLAVASNLLELSDDHGPELNELFESIVAKCIPALSEHFGKSFTSGRGRSYIGFAHGDAGIIGSLAGARAHLKRNAELRVQLTELVNQMIARVVAQIDDNGSVPRGYDDLRKDAAWCHGAPGVLLGLCIALEQGFDVQRNTLKLLADFTQKHGIGNNVTLCHGDLGSLSVLWRYSETIGDVESARVWREELQKRSQQLAIRGRFGYSDKYASTDSLMLGRAGALLTFLRTLDPLVFPDVLSLGI